jgi:hypothetical protein
MAPLEMSSTWVLLSPIKGTKEGATQAERRKNRHIAAAKGPDPREKDAGVSVIFLLFPK